MREQAEALTALMAECAGDEAYVRLYLGSNGEAKALIDKIAKAAWNQYSEGTVYVLKEGAIEAFLSASGVSLKDFSPDVADKVRQTDIEGEDLFSAAEVFPVGDGRYLIVEG